MLSPGAKRAIGYLSITVVSLDNTLTAAAWITYCKRTA